MSLELIFRTCQCGIDDQRLKEGHTVEQHLDLASKIKNPKKRFTLQYHILIMSDLIE